MMEWIIYIVLFGISTTGLLMARNARAHARLALQETQKAIAAKDVAEKTMIAILDDDGNVRGQLRLPGQIPKQPITTPCGELCAHSLEVRGAALQRDVYLVEWHCKAHHGSPIGIARPEFLDETNNCVMFERDED